MATVTRRTAIRAALGSWLCADYGFPAVQARAQTESATPIAGQTAEPRSGLALPAGITSRQTPRQHQGHRREAERCDSFALARV